MKNKRSSFGCPRMYMKGWGWVGDKVVRLGLSGRVDEHPRRFHKICTSRGQQEGKISTTKMFASNLF